MSMSPKRVLSAGIVNIPPGGKGLINSGFYNQSQFKNQRKLSNAQEVEADNSRGLNAISEKREKRDTFADDTRKFR